MKSSTDIALTLHAICERLERIEALLADRDELVGVGEDSFRRHAANGELPAVQKQFDRSRNGKSRKRHCRKYHRNYGQSPIATNFICQSRLHG